MELQGVIKDVVDRLEAEKRKIQSAIDALIGANESNGDADPTAKEAAVRMRKSKKRAKVETKTRRKKSGGGATSESTKYHVGKGELSRVMTGEQALTIEEIARKLSGAFKGIRFTVKAIEASLDKYCEKVGDGWKLAE